jgi:hypothetical protein
MSTKRKEVDSLEAWDERSNLVKLEREASEAIAARSKRHGLKYQSTTSWFRENL